MHFHLPLSIPAQSVQILCAIERKHRASQTKIIWYDWVQLSTPKLLHQSFYKHLHEHLRAMVVLSRNWLFVRIARSSTSIMDKYYRMMSRSTISAQVSTRCEQTPAVDSIGLLHHLPMIIQQLSKMTFG